MRKLQLNGGSSLILVFSFLTILLTACSQTSTQDKAALEFRRGMFERLQRNLSEPIITRVQEMPSDMLKALKDYDLSIGMGNSSKYVARMATAEELALINSYFNLLPNSYQTILKRKLLAVYLIDGFSGAGLTDWVVDRDGNTYYYLAFNSSLLHETIDDWLTYKENSFFDNSALSPVVRVHTKTKFKAMMYGLLHEGAHIVDYELAITPYLDPLHRHLKGRTQESSAFTNGVWVRRTQPETRYDFKHRVDLNLYGSVKARGLIPRSELVGMFSQLTKTPFVNFYSGTSWNEDLADYFTYQYIEKKLGGTVSVELIQQDSTIERYEPLRTNVAQERERFVRDFYE
jgi:hypothetical protein